MSDVATPWPVVDVPLGTVVVFHFFVQRKPPSPTPVRKFVWEAEKVDFEEFGPCGTDLLVRRRLFHWKAGVWVEKSVIAPPLEVSSNNRGGPPRLRVGVGDQTWGPGCGRVYLQKVAAWCFHRGRFASGVTWADFASDRHWEADHLPDAQLDPRSHLVLCGAVEAVPGHVNRRRRKYVDVARAAVAEALELERAAAKEAELFAALRARAKAKAKAKPKAKPKARRVVTDLPRPEPAARALRAADKEGVQLLSFDISWEHALASARAFEGESDDDDDDAWTRNPCGAVLFVQLETAAGAGGAAAGARKSLLAYSLAKQHRLFFADQIDE